MPSDASRPNVRKTNKERDCLDRFIAKEWISSVEANLEVILCNCNQSVIA